jgi:hypothetical protein
MHAQEHFALPLIQIVHAQGATLAVVHVDVVGGEGIVWQIFESLIRRSDDIHARISS